MHDDLKAPLAAAIDRYVQILADHGLILDAECTEFITEPVYGAYVFLSRAMHAIDPSYPRIDRIHSPVGPGETHERLEGQLAESDRSLSHCAYVVKMGPVSSLSSTT